MTVDDEKSIYVGGLPLDCSENTLRKAFELFGAIVAVKIVNDHEVGGKCYGFVTFSNPRGAVDAINDMNGQEIGGRVVRVNEVKTRGGRPHFNRGNSRRDTQRFLDRDRDRHRERDNDLDRERYRDRNIGKSRDRDLDWGTEHEHVRGHDRNKDRFVNEDRDRDGDRENNKHEWSRKQQDRGLKRNIDLDWERDKELDITSDHDKGENYRDKDEDHQSKYRTGSLFTDRRSRELSSNSSDDYQDQVKEQLELSIQTRNELQLQITSIQEKLDGREKYVLDLQKRSQKLEDALTTEKKLSSQRRMQLTKFQRCILQVNDCTAELKNSEQELQSLVDRVEVGAVDMEDAAVMDGSVYINGKA